MKCIVQESTACWEEPRSRNLIYSVPFGTFHKVPAIYSVSTCKDSDFDLKQTDGSATYTTNDFSLLRTKIILREFFELQTRNCLYNYIFILSPK